MWNYSLNWKSLKFNQGQLTENRLDRILVTSMNARNITEARLKIQRGIVVVNGSVVFNYNVIIAANDIVQVRDNIQNSLSLLLQKRVSVVKERGLFV
jgi:ribosomal protein S4